MTFPRLCLALASLLVAACSSSVDSQSSNDHPTPAPTPTPTPAADLKDACQELAKARELHDQRCGAQAWSNEARAAEIDACVELGSRPSIVVDLAQAAVCAAAIPGSWCGDGDPSIDHACAYLHGTAAVGGSCQDSAQCVSGLCVSGTAGGACGVCAATVGLGGACDDTHVCDFTGDTRLTCTAGKCVLQGTPPGGACTSYGGLNDCIGGYYCKPNSPNQGVDGTCVARPTTGNACDPTLAPCIETDACVGAGGTSVCKPKTIAATGMPCDAAASCKEGDVCASTGPASGVCKTPSEHVAAGSACDQVDRCAPGLVCGDAQKCLATNATVGAPCPCAGDLACVGGACVARAVGVVCHGVTGGECGRDLYCKVTMPPSEMLLGTCAPRVPPGGDCSFASSFEQNDICMAPYFCGSVTGRCEVEDPVCTAP